MMKEKLADLQFMSEELDIPITIDAYEKTVKNIEGTLKEIVTRSVKELQDQLQNKNTITQEILSRVTETYQSAIQLSKILNEGGHAERVLG